MADFQEILDIKADFPEILVMAVFQKIFVIWGSITRDSYHAVF
jgi:hypothetical protein